MNCPYCDEVINAMAKFCPKCGLPLKEDSTVMGTYVSDGEGPNWGILGLGAGAILVIALAIGLLGRNSTTPETVRREPVGQFGAPGTSPGFRSSAPLYNSTPNPGYQQRSTPSMSTSRPRWAYTPPATPAPAPPMAYVPQGPEAPRHFNIMAPVIQRRPPVVEIARSNEPAVPSMSPGELALLSQMYNGVSGLDGDGVGLDLTPEAALNNQISRTEAEGVWVYDPVQERWALRPDAKRRRAAPRQQIDTFPAPTATPSEPIDIVPVN
jgi:hypothetical protein